MDSKDKITYLRNYCNFQQLEYVELNEEELNIVYNYIANNVGLLPENPTSNTILYFGLKYKVDENYPKMQEYYIKAIELGNSNAMYYYASFYVHKHEEEFLVMPLLEKAIALGNTNAMVAVAKYYRTKWFLYLGAQEYVELVEKYCLMAINLNDSNAMFVLGDFYEMQKQYDKMKEYYLMAIKHKNTKAMIKLADYYGCIEKDFILMEQYLDKAIDCGDLKAMGYYAEYCRHYKSIDILNKYLRLILKTKCEFARFITINQSLFDDETYNLLERIPAECLTSKLNNILKEHKK